MGTMHESMKHGVNRPTGTGALTTTRLNRRGLAAKHAAGGGEEEGAARGRPSMKFMVVFNSMQTGCQDLKGESEKKTGETVPNKNARGRVKPKRASRRQ